MTNTQTAGSTVADLTKGTVIRVRRYDNYTGDVFIPDPDGNETREFDYAYPSMIRGAGVVIQYAPYGLSFAVPPSTPVAIVE